MFNLRHAHGSQWKLLQMRELRQHERVLLGKVHSRSLEAEDRLQVNERHSIPLESCELGTHECQAEPTGLHSPSLIERTK